MISGQMGKIGHNLCVFGRDQHGATMYSLGRGCWPSDSLWFKHYEGDMISFRAKLAIQLTFQAWTDSGHRLIFCTFTLPDGGRSFSADDFAKMYKRFMRDAKSNDCWPSFGFRCWERHSDSRGFHLHLVLPRRGVRWALLKSTWAMLGGGRCHVRFVQDDAGTLALYLSNEVGKWNQKNFEDCGRRVRSWATWGDGRCVCSDIILTTPISRLLKPWGKLSKGKRFTLMRQMRYALSRGWNPSAFAYVDIREQRDALARFANKPETGEIIAYTERVQNP